jgi:DNA-binding response OmpR family regulator
MKIKDANILYIEDDEVTREQLAQFLRSQCKTLYTASEGAEGFALFEKFRPHIVITDIEMPKMNGLEMTRKIRAVSHLTQVIILSAYTKPEYLLEAVNLQLIQYLTKPVSLARITSALKLASDFLDCTEVQTKKVLMEDAYYDMYTKELVFDNQIVNLSKYERALLELLIQNHPAPVSYEVIDSEVYDYSSSKNAIKLLVSSLREKVSKESIINISGFGYKLNLLDDR